MSEEIEPHQENEMDIQLELKDRINYPEILQKSLENITNIYNSPKDFDPTLVERIMLDLFYSIPTTWFDTDEEFKKDVKNSIQKMTIDIRPMFCGIKPSIELCIKKKIPYQKETITLDFYKLKRSIIDLLDRRRLLVRHEKIEMTTGKNLDYEKNMPELKDVETEDGKDEYA